MNCECCSQPVRGRRRRNGDGQLVCPTCYADAPPPETTADPLSRSLARVNGPGQPEHLIVVARAGKRSEVLCKEGIAFTAGIQGACVLEPGTDGTTSPSVGVTGRVSYT